MMSEGVESHLSQSESGWNGQMGCFHQISILQIASLNRR